MDPLQDKVLGSWMGMAIGDAMGLAVKGLKPETVSQCFREWDSFQDVRPFIGKGIKRYRMKGLYGTRTQSALAVCDALLKNKKAGIESIADSLKRLAAGGPDYYFGVYRHTDAPFRKSVNSLLSRSDLIPADQGLSAGGTPVMSVPMALLERAHSPSMTDRCLETALLMTRNFLEVVGTALTGWLVIRFLSLRLEEDSLWQIAVEKMLAAAGDYCVGVQSHLRDRFPELWEEVGDEEGEALAKTLHALKDKFSLEEKELTAWVCSNAREHLQVEPIHPASGHLLVLLPLALILVLKPPLNFDSAVIRAVRLGREADKLGSLVGALAGALYGFSAVPDPWKSGLVNGKEIRARGEALYLRRFTKGLKDLYEMESGLTAKEYEEGKRYLSVKPRPAKGKPSAMPFFDEDGDDFLLPPREDAAARRKFQKEKTRQKRDRRRNVPGNKNFK